MTKQSTNTKLAKRVALLRIGFGLIWAVDAAFKWQPAFINSFMDNISSAAQGQPAWLTPWFNWWNHLLGSNPTFFAYSTATIESLIAIALIFGFARRLTYLAAVVFSLLIWSVAEGFGGPYTASSTDIGTAIVYAVVFLALYGLEQLAGEAKYSVDDAIERKLPWWKIIAEPSQ